MPWNLLILPRLGGFLFISHCHYYRIQSQRYESYRLVLESACWAAGFLIAGRILVDVGARTGYFRFVEKWLETLAPFPYIGSAVAAFALGPAVAWLVNRSVDTVRAKDIAIEQSGDKLLGLLYDAMDDSAPVMFTLENRKVYIGNVWESPNLETAATYVLLLPAMSGFRDSETLRLTLTTDYISLWSGGEHARHEAEKFVMVIPIASIKTASRFDLDLYETHFSAKLVAS
jgi:hypothetical protein